PGESSGADAATGLPRRLLPDPGRGRVRERPRGADDRGCGPCRAMLLTTARFGLVEPFVPDRLAGVCGRIGREAVLGSGGKDDAIRLWVSPPRPLREYSETHSAPHAVLTGHQTPRDLPLDGPLAAAGTDLRLRGLDPDRTDPRVLFGA